MDCKDKVKGMFSYLLNVKNLSEKVIRNVWDYENIYWESKLNDSIGCSVNKGDREEWWLKINKNCERIYDQFLKLYLELEKRGDNTEIIWGHGLIAWNFHGHKIVHPIFATRMKLNFNVENESFSLIPDNKTVMETSIFEGINIPNLRSILKIERKLDSVKLDPRRMENIEGTLTEIAAYLSVDGRVDKEEISVDKLSLLNYPVIYNEPVILIRKSNMRLWQKEITDIINGIDKGYMIPQTIEALVEDKKIDQNDINFKEWQSVNKEIFFPLSSNYEQKEIVKKICENYGVVVQGPPGTGKSHTIVNLICHLLAHGKRILITSQTDSTLKILSNKIPDQIKPFCLSVLGNDANSLIELSESVKRIIDNMSTDPQSLYKEIENLKEELETCREKQNSLFIRFREIQRKENGTISLSGKEYKIVDIAKWVKLNQSKHSWIEDKVKLGQQLPLDENEFQKLKCLLGEVSKEHRETLKSISIVINKVPSSYEICNCIYRLKELGNSYEDYLNTIEGWRVPDNNRCNYDKLLGLLQKCKYQMEELDKGIFGKILSEYYYSQEVRESLNYILRKCNDYMLMMNNIKSELKKHKIEIPESIEFNKFIRDFDTLYDNLSLNKKVGRLFKVIHPECNYIVKGCKVDDRLLENLEQARVVKLYIQNELIFKELKGLINNLIKEYGGKIITLEDKKLGLMFIEDYIKKLNNIVNWDNKYKRQLILALGKISVPKDVDWHKKSSYDYLIKCVQCIKSLDEYNNLKVHLEILRKLVLATGRLSELSEAIEELNITKIRMALNKVEDFRRIKNKSLELDNIIEKLKNVCPKTSEKVIKQLEKGELSFKDLQIAWKWTKYNSLLQGIHGVGASSIEREIEEEKNKEKVIIEQIIAKKTLYNQILRTSESEKRSLFSWMQAVNRIGKGTGKMVTEYRKIAQDEMEKCKGVIPVWIMPLNKVIENIKVSEELFDVVIFDESSQSDIFSICALMRGKKAIIVGDDKQIGLEPSGIDQGLIEDLISKHLRSMPQREWFDLQTSLYDTALRVFPSRLMLKEHFRCLPEIIDFSNKAFYSNKIMPLRYDRPYEQIYSPVVPIRVSGGYKEQNKPINIPEAECLVDKLVQCCKDKRYMGMTIGVVSLLGEAQSELIENMIRERIGQEEILSRRIICGDAHSFQGDERDIMFLSMVVSKNAKFTSITREADIRKFNIATSRAKNQMWLFHSVDLEDLSPNCVRYSLLNYFTIHKKKNKKDIKLEPVFKSTFQKDVYELIRSKGYCPTLEVKLGTFKMDFVIEGVKGRIAVICDEETPNNKYEWSESIERQLDLKKLGWTFYRIRGSEFYYDPDKTMKELWGKLREISIEKCNGEELIIKNLKVV